MVLGNDRHRRRCCGHTDPTLLNAGRRAPALIGHTGATGSWAFHSPEAGLYLAGTFDDPRAAAAPFRIVPALIRAHSD